jgi:outer membrane protein assembly factor BamB
MSAEVGTLLHRCRGALVLLFLASRLCAQPFVQRLDPVVVEHPDGSAYLNPFSGGLLSPRIGLTDVDGDGALDLFALNPDNRLRLYRNEGSFSFRRILPSAYDSLPVRNWFRFTDIDGDGDDDLFTSSERLQILLYRNDGSQSEPRFSSVPDTLRGSDGITIFNDQITIPAFVDIDGDGDLDLFIGNSDGTITFYENRGSRSVPSFTFITGVFQGIQVISPASAKKGRGGVIQHGASVQSFIDLDGDGDLDMLFGDYFTKKLLYFHNDGTRSLPRFSMSRLDTAFLPAGDEVESSQGFNQTVAGDIDRDGDLDVIVSSLFPQATAQPLILYRNLGSATSPQMKRQTLDLVNEIDVGTFATPSPIVDAERNGVLIGSTDPSLEYFELRVENGRTIWRQAKRYPLPAAFQQTTPAAGDLDGDGAAEVIVGTSTGNVRLLRFSAGNLLNVPWQLDTFKVNQNASPALVDLDGDGDLDLFIGAGSGRFTYFENIGSRTAPLFERKTPPAPFDTFDIGSNSAPRFFDLDGDGDPDAIVGGRPGGSASPDDPHRVQFFLNENGSFVRSARYPDITSAQNPSPMMLRLPEGLFLFIGDQAGGLLAFVDSSTTSGVEGEREKGGMVSATPTVLGGSDRSILLRWDLEKSPIFTLIDPLGREVVRMPLEMRSGSRRIVLPELPSGIYLFRIGSEGSVGKIMVMR